MIALQQSNCRGNPDGWGGWGGVGEEVLFRLHESKLIMYNKRFRRQLSLDLPREREEWYMHINLCGGVIHMLPVGYDEINRILEGTYFA